MSYYSELDLYKQYTGNRVDNSFPLPSAVISWRIDDLQQRLTELEYKGKSDSYGYSRISKEDLPYVLPEHMFNPNDILSAIEMAKKNLIETQLEESESYCEVAPTARSYTHGVVIMPMANAIKKYGDKRRAITNDRS